MGSRRGFICRMKIGNVPVDPMTSSHTVRIRQRNTLGPSSDGQNYAVVHVTGYIKNWPPSGKLLQKLGVLNLQQKYNREFTFVCISCQMLQESVNELG